MRKFYFLVLGLLFFSALKAQIVNIPDVVFKDLLLSASITDNIAEDLQGNYIKIDVNNNNEIEISEALEITKLNP